VSEESKPHSTHHEAAVELGRLGGKRGGPARAAALSADERSAIAKKAAAARWAKHRLESKKTKKSPPKKGKK
jgi:hypothetical protein